MRDRDARAFYNWHAQIMRKMPMEAIPIAERDYWTNLLTDYEQEKSRCRALDRHEFVPRAIRYFEHRRSDGLIAAPGMHVLVDHFENITGPEYRLTVTLVGALRSVHDILRPSPDEPGRFPRLYSAMVHLGLPERS